MDGSETRRCLSRALIVLGRAAGVECDGPAGGAWGVLGVTKEYSMMVECEQQAQLEQIDGGGRYKTTDD